MIVKNFESGDRMNFNRSKYALTGALTAIILIVICICCYVFNVKANSPDHAIQMVEESLKTHDEKKFNNAVDVDTLLNTSYDSFVDGMINFDKTMPEEVKDSVANFTQLLKVPLMASMKTAIDNYVATGSFEPQSKNDLNKDNIDANLMAASEILDRAGINKIEFRQIDSVKVDNDNKNLAIAEVRIYQQEAARDFIFEVVLEKNSDGDWKVTSIKNFSNFVAMMNQARRSQLDRYLEETAAIMNRHDKTILEAEQKYGSILSIGSLGQDNTRNDLKTLITDVVKKDWEVRKQELFNVNVPKGAEALQNLRIKICDLSIESADLYAKWMSDKKAATIKDAEDKRKQVQTLREEEKILVNRMMK